MLTEKTSIKDVIESCGVPHTEVDLIIRSDIPPEAVDFERTVQGPARLFIHSTPAPAGVLPEAPRLQSRTCRRFVVDGHLGKLARDLRLLGFDTFFEAHADDGRLLEVMLADQRALITRDRRLLMHSIVRDGYCPRSADPQVQTREVLRRFDLARGLDGTLSFRRCLLCNAPLEAVPKSEVTEALADEPLTLRHHDAFLRCTGCRKIYWRGTHFEKLAARLHRLLIP